MGNDGNMKLRKFLLFSVKSLFLLIGIGFILLCIVFFVFQGGFLDIPETTVSDAIKVGDKEFYLTISGHSYVGMGDSGPFVEELKMNIVTEGEIIQRLVVVEDETTRKKIRNKIQKRYDLSLGDQIPHIIVKHDGRILGFFHVAGLKFVRTHLPLNPQNIRDYSIERLNAKKFVLQQIDLSLYDSYYYVNEHLTGASSRKLFSNEKRSLIILGDDFVNHDIIYTKGDVYVSKHAHLMAPVISENTIFLIGSKEVKRRKLNDLEAGKIRYM
jgi:hypothetical protein